MFYVKNKLNKRYKLQDIGFSGLFFQEISIRLVPLLPSNITPNFITFMGFISSILVFYFISVGSSIAGYLILIALWLDLSDGYVARHLGKTSNFGHLFDALVDMILWLGVILGLYFYNQSTIQLYIISIYLINIYIRFQIKTLSFTSNPKIESNIVVSSGNFLKKRLLTNHFDVMTILSILLIYNIEYSFYWLIYELLRRGIQFISTIYKVYIFYDDEK
jgi:phosphatidylglycerophosphate synthase